MAKQYTFTIQIRKASFSNGVMSVPYGTPDDVYWEGYFTGTLNDALRQFEALSAEESRPHTAYLSMAKRMDRLPHGFNKSKTRINFNPDAKVAA